jgi:ATP-dependent protease HslVU (ClpYQ) peptidase subunit
VTTIAYKAGILAADTQVTCGDGSKMRARKIQELPDGSFYACAGDTSAILRIQRWMARGMPRRNRPRVPKDAEADLLMVKPDGSAWLLNDGFDFERVETPFVAIGSGAAYALGAMARGATAVQAIKIAAKFDVNTSAPIDSVSARNAEAAPNLAAAKS